MSKWPFTMYPPSNERREAVGNSASSLFFLTVVSAPRFSVLGGETGDRRSGAPLNNRRAAGIDGKSKHRMWKCSTGCSKGDMAPGYSN